MMRARLQWWARTASRLLIFSACGLLALWATGRACGDRWLWSQYLSWLPTVLVIPASMAAIALSRLLGRIGRVERRAGRVLRYAAWIGVVGATLHVALIEWRWLGRGDASVTREDRLRIVFWNCSRRARDFEKAIVSQNPDIAVMLPGNGTTFGKLQEAMGPDADFVYHGFAVMSRYKIKRWATIGLRIQPGSGLDPRQENFKARFTDPGKALFLQLDTQTKLGRDLVIWLVDLPSDLSLPRAKVAAEARTAIDDFVSGRADRWLQSNWSRTDAENSAYSDPDLILGDFNTPRGSRSLSTLTGELRNAYDLAGDGYAATYPRTWPLWHLDQAYAAESVRVVGYEIIDPGAGTHRMQRLDIGKALGTGH